MQSEEEENFYDSLAEVAPANSGGDFEDGVSGVFAEDQGSDLSQEIEWDNYQDGPSFLTNSSNFSYPGDLDIARRISSTDNNLLDRSINEFLDPLEENLLPLDLRFLEDEDEVEANSEFFLEMPTTRQPASIYRQFEEDVDLWNTEFEKYIQVPADGAEALVIDDVVAREAKERYEEINELFKQIRIADANHATNFPNLVQKRISLNESKIKLLSKFNSQSNSSIDENALEKDIDNRLDALSGKFDMLEHSIQSKTAEMNKLIQEYPQPTAIDCEEAQTLNGKFSEIKEYLHINQLEAKGVAKKYSNLLKKTNAIKTVDERSNRLQAAIESMIDKGRTYVRSRVIASSEESSTGSTGHAEVRHSRNNLERLPLPVFNGNEMHYLRFKQDFQTHVKYDTENERVHALKTKCLKKAEDKKKVANLDTLNECWSCLDEKYGDKNVLITRILNTWDQFKTPKNDSEFVKFVEDVEEHVSIIKKVRSPTEIHSDLYAVKLESKLPEYELKVYTQECSQSGITSGDHRMKYLLTFLSNQKKACNLRLANIPKDKKKKEKDDDPPTSSHFSGVQGEKDKKPKQGKQVESGKGKGKQSPGKGGKAGQSKFEDQKKRGEPSTKCLICDEDHATSKCGHLRDRKVDKGQLWTLLHTQVGAQSFCYWCLEPGHWTLKCRNKNNEEMQCPCGADVNKYLCSSTDDCKTRANWTTADSKSNNSIISSSTVLNGAPIGEALLPIQAVNSYPQLPLEKPLTVMFDNCSQNTFISNQTASNLKLKGTPVSFVLICTDGSKKPMTGKLYKLSLIDINGTLHEVEAVGLDQLSSIYPGIKVRNIKRLLGNLPVFASISDKMFIRKPGMLDLLVGSDLASLHPKAMKNIGQLSVMKSIFGTGWTLHGHNKDCIIFTSKHKGTKANCCAVQSLKPIGAPEINCHTAATKDLQFLDAMSTESIGVQVPPKCTSCKAISDKCLECKAATNSMTYLEYLQDQEINSKIEYQPEKQRYIASYPYTKEILDLLPNKELAMKRAESLEATLLKTPQDLELLNKSIADSFERGLFRYLDDEEIENWTGLVHYVAMNRVYKDSDSTPVRLVFDSGQPDRNNRSLNGCMGKGQNPLNHMGEVIINFRCAEQVACGDISKMFNNIDVRLEDQHLRRFFIRPDGIGGKEPYKIAVITKVNFGERAAGSVATAVKNKCADQNKEINTDVAKMIKKDCFMDDMNINAKYNESLDKNTFDADQILAKGGFRVKSWIKSGDKQEVEIAKSEADVQKSLGMCWKTDTDELYYKVKLNFTKKTRNRYSGAFSTKQTLKEDFPKKFTKRLALKLNHTLYDPAMLLQPWIQKLRLAYRDILIYTKEKEISGWDTELPDNFRNTWIDLTMEMFDIEDLRFPRSVVPKNYDKTFKPLLVTFSDGSDQACCAVAYLVWKLKNGEFHVSLITSRTKIASLKKLSTVRIELNGALLQCRLQVWLSMIMDIELGETIHIVDSSVVLGMLTNLSLKFDAYTSPRLTEIQTNTKIGSWFWIETAENPSDLGTRSKVSVTDLDSNSVWQNGPAWLRTPRESWPLRSDFRKHDIPGIKKEFQILQSINNLTELADLALFNSTLDQNKQTNSSSVCSNTQSNSSSSDIKNTTRGVAGLGNTKDNGVLANTTRPNGVPFNTTGSNGQQCVKSI